MIPLIQSKIWKEKVMSSWYRVWFLLQRSEGKETIGKDSNTLYLIRLIIILWLLMLFLPFSSPFHHPCNHIHRLIIKSPSESIATPVESQTCNDGIVKRNRSCNTKLVRKARVREQQRERISHWEIFKKQSSWINQTVVKVAKGYE